MLLFLFVSFPKFLGDYLVFFRIKEWERAYFGVIRVYGFLSRSLLTKLFADEERPYSSKFISLLHIFLIVDAIYWVLNGRLPVSISKQIIPTAQVSTGMP